MQRARVGLTVGYRILRKFAVVLDGFYRDTNISNGNNDDSPSTQRFAPGLAGVHGAPSNYLSAALVYNSRDDLVRPTEGWEMIIKYLNADHALFNRDTDYQKLLFDVSFIQPLVWRRQVIALHANTEVVFGDDEDIPFFELSSLGGDDTMRGYFPQRFLGKGSALINAEYRLKLVDFNFRKLWDVSIDGVGFGDVGRVYEGSEDFLEHTLDHVRYSYGGGVRIALLLGSGGAHRRRLQPRGTGPRLSHLRPHLLRRCARWRDDESWIALGLAAVIGWRAASGPAAATTTTATRASASAVRSTSISGCFNECRELCLAGDPDCESRCAAQCDECRRDLVVRRRAADGCTGDSPRCAPSNETSSAATASYGGPASPERPTLSCARATRAARRARRLPPAARASSRSPARPDRRRRR